MPAPVAPPAPPIASPDASAKAPIHAEDAGLVFDPASAIWSPDKKLAVTLVEFRAHVWDGATKAHLRELGDAMVVEAVFSPDGKTLYLAYENLAPAAVRDPGGRAESSSFELVKGIPKEGDRGTGMPSVSANGAWLLARCNTVAVCLYDTKTFSGRMWSQPKSDGDPTLTSLAFDAKDKRIVVKNAAGASFELDVPSLRRVR